MSFIIERGNSWGFNIFRINSMCEKNRPKAPKKLKL